MEVDTENHIVISGDVPPQLKPSSVPMTPQPLQPMSLERQNQIRLPQSMSVPCSLDGHDSPRKSHHHRNSDAADVKARIAYLNSVSQTNSPTRSISPAKASTSNVSHAAIQRAMLGREEAETALTSLASQLESSKARERMVCERVETLMEQLNEVRNRQKHERTVYEKEIRQSKKTEYKAELAFIKLQEDLREARSELENSRTRNEHDKAEKEKARQEAFERAYVVAGMTEELQEIKSRLEATKHERDAAIAMAASKTLVEEIALPAEPKDAQQASEKRKRSAPETQLFFGDEVDLEATDCHIDVKFAALQTENHYLRQRIQKNEETIHFMNIQCQFKACPCRAAERDGVRFVHDYDYDAKVREQNAKRRKTEDIGPQLPLPTFRSLRQRQEEQKGKQPVLPNSAQTEIQEAETQDHLVVKTDESPLGMVTAQDSQPILAGNIPPSQLPLSDTLTTVDEIVEGTIVLEAAVNVPLPLLEHDETNSIINTSEPTAQLEELTQVIVESNACTTDFLFTPFTTSNKAASADIQDLRQSHNMRTSNDLFDISPPKRDLPPRPSTALGVLSVGSPIRLVPDSPHQLGQRSLTPDINLPRSTTTRIALNDTSPVREARQARTGPRPNVQLHSRGRSPAPRRVGANNKFSQVLATEVTDTPTLKRDHGSRVHATIQPRPQTSQGHYASADVKELSSTTVVPLRDDSSIRYLQPIDTTAASETQGPASAPASATTSAFSVPGTPKVTREQALAQIRARRDRARSINMRKSADEGNKTPGTAARRGLNLKDRLGDGKGRDFSQASAPGRI